MVFDYYREEIEKDPLVNPVVPPWMLEQMDFGPKYQRTEQLLYWLTRWSGRNHALGGKVSNNYTGSRLQRIHWVPLTVRLY